MSNDAYTEWDAAYVLGSLSSADRAEFERHLGTCAACSAAVTELAGLPGLLSKLGTEEAVALPALPRDGHLVGVRHEAGEVQRLAASVSRLRRRSRVTFAAIASGLVAASIVGGIAIGSATVSVPSPPVAVAMTPIEANTMTAALAITPTAWGTKFEWSCSYSQGDWVNSAFTSKPWRYELVAIDQAGAETVVATWAAGEEASGLSAVSSLPTDSIASVEIRAAGSERVLTRTDL